MTPAKLSDLSKERLSLGDILVDVGVISTDQLQRARTEAKGSERDLGKALVDLGFTTEEKIMKGIGIKAKVPYFLSLEGLVTAESATLISEELARRLQIVPLFKVDNVVTIAMVNPMDIVTIDALTKTLRLKVEPVVCMRTTIFDTINKLYGGWEGNKPPELQRQRPAAVSEVIETPQAPEPPPLVIVEPTSSEPPAMQTPAPVAEPPAPESISLPPPVQPVIAAQQSPAPPAPTAPVAPAKTPEPLRPGQPQKKTMEEFQLSRLAENAKAKMPEHRMNQFELMQRDIKKASSDMPVVQLVDELYKQAVAKKASDIHIEPLTDHTEVRFRIDGVLRPIMRIPKEIEAAVTARVKVMANLDITETRQPQDGRILTELNYRPVDLRISTLPVIHGEKVVIRILDKGSIDFKLASLGLSAQQEVLFKEVLQRPNGIVLVTGPTGSGKSTTLYTALTLLNSPDRNIVTLEDPVEYQLQHVNQVQVNAKVGLTFARGLRSILRQDPDVMMVGEIRDQETAEIAIQSALTGHLVLSTLHTNDAASAVTRLINMKVEPFLISASINLIIAQRLVRMLCPACKEAYDPPAAIADRFRQAMQSPGPLSFYQAKGCAQCYQMGYKGRRGVYEILPITTEFREAIAMNRTLDSLRQIARAQGLLSLFDAGAHLVAGGITTVEELLRVCHIEA